MNARRAVSDLIKMICYKAIFLALCTVPFFKQYSPHPFTCPITSNMFSTKNYNPLVSTTKSPKKRNLGEKKLIKDQVPSSFSD